MTRTPRIIAATGIAAVALLGSALVATPAHSEPAPAIGVTDGTTPDSDAYPSGANLSLLVNGASTGDFTFTGCWGVFSSEDDDPLFMSSAPAATTWTGGTAISTLFPSIDLTPEASIAYYVEVFEPVSEEPLFVEPQGSVEPADASTACADLYVTGPYLDIAFIQFGVFVPQSMTLTGTPRLGETVTVAAKVAGSLVGQDFDLWACPDRTIYPDDNAAEGANGECYGPIIQVRNGDTTQFLLGYDPERDGTGADDKAAAEAEWAEFCGKSFIVHDYPGGGHSNWIGPIDCTTAAELAETGAGDFAGAISIGALVAMLLGAVLLVTRRTREASIR
ncbi:hypothetical protein [Microcella sp.]|uniref:hypothetical protein n=1 Tax=Microcella sp. TaxID=1913979 RepID=UPI00256586FC|nr:hypothetical protein [Microcella sp.]MBX9472884.1 hypothetical protein [Microcella sp.]